MSRVKDGGDNERLSFALAAPAGTWAASGQQILVLHASTIGHEYGLRYALLCCGLQTRRKVDMHAVQDRAAGFEYR
jgi:hypothetical protein